MVLLVVISVLILLFPQKVEEKGNEVATSVNLTTEYAKPFRFQDMSDIRLSSFLSPEGPIGPEQKKEEKEPKKIVVEVLLDIVTDSESEATADYLVNETTLDYLREVFGDKYDEAAKILDCESGGNLRAYNPELVAKARGITKWSSCGLFQINSPLCYKDKSALYDPIVNIDAAKVKYDYSLEHRGNGWFPWAICKKKKSL